MTINLSNTHGKNNYNRKTVVKNTTKRRLSSTRKLKVVGGNNSIYQKPVATPPPTSLISLIINTLFRITIVGVGIGTLFGSFLANRDLTKPLFPEINLSWVENIFPSVEESEPNKITSNPNQSVLSVAPEKEKEKIDLNQGVKFTKEVTSLKNKFNQLKAKYPQLEPSAFFVDLDNGAYVNFNGIKTFSAASTIKIPILVAFFQDVDAGKIYLDEEFTMTKSNLGSGSGGMQYKPLGSKYNAIYTATEMIINSDNTATNIIMERLGGAAKLNKRFQEWGLENTVINNLLPDLKGTNTTTARDLAMVLAKVNQGELISLRSRDRLMDIMKKTRTRTLLPQGLETGAVIAHKTGDIGTVLGDAGIIDMPTGKRYIGAVFVARPHNDYSARTLIQQISRTAYQHFKWYLPRPTTTKN